MIIHNFQPENGWEADLDDMASLIDERTKLIVVVNPSNPCGSVYKREHLEEILNSKYLKTCTSFFRRFDQQTSCIHIGLIFLQLLKNTASQFSVMKFTRMS